MKILNILTNEEVTSTEKVEAVMEFVTTVRAKYGNADKEITAVKVPTTNGYVPISLLTVNEKVAIAEGEIREIIAMTTAVIENAEGSLFDRVFEGFVAVNPVLVNLGETSDSEY